MNNFRITKYKYNVKSVIRKVVDGGDQDEAFFVCDIGEIIRKHLEWKSEMPRVHPYYAVKCNDSPEVLTTLAAVGVNFDCASKDEISKIIQLGISPSRIIFANPVKPQSHIEYAVATDVTVTTFDSEAELYKIKKINPDMKLLLRIQSNATDSAVNLGLKFGCDPGNEARNLIKLSKSLGLNVIGICFHVGSGCRELEAYRRAIKKSKELFNFAKSCGYYDFDLLDIGGGFPGENGTSIRKFGQIINSALEEYFPENYVKVVAEPGSYFVTSAFTLACNIHSIREVSHNNNERHKMYFINDGNYGSFLVMVLVDKRKVTPIPLYKKKNCKSFSSSFWGPTMDSLDLVVENLTFQEMEIGDWVFFEDMGAYTVPVSTNFNGFPRSKVFYAAKYEIAKLMGEKFMFVQEDF